MSYCYLLYSRNNTYIGATVNPDHRLRQHNGEIVGGAKRTKGHVWKRALYVSGFPNWVAALQFEWAWKRKGRGRPGLVGKLVGLIELVREIRSTRNAVEFSAWPAPPAYHWEAEARLFAEKIEALRYLFPIIPPNILTTNLTNLTYLTNMSLPTLPELSHTVGLLTLQVSELNTRLTTALAQIASGPAIIAAPTVATGAPKKRKSKKATATATATESATATATAASESATESNSSNSASSSSSSATETSSKKSKKEKAPKEPKEPKEKATCLAAAEGVVRFSGSTGKSPYIAFSPLYKAEFAVDGKTYGTVENYVQATKYVSTNAELAEQLRTNDKPATLRMAGNAKKYADIVAPGYDLANAYATAYAAQFGGNEALRTVLLSTGSAPLEGEYTDAVLGVGVDGAGQNIIGNALMSARSTLSA